MWTPVFQRSSRYLLFCCSDDDSMAACCDDDDDDEQIDKICKPQFSCDICGKTYKQRNSLRKHLDTHSTEKMSDPNQSKPLKQCEICEKLVSKNGYSRHKKSHSDERSFECEICSKTFVRIGNLKLHKMIHLAERRFKCDICGKAFLKLAHLVEHTETHNPKKQFICDICDKSFSGKGLIVRHIRTHITEKRFKCVICDKTFCRKEHLVRHVKMHDPTNDARPFPCDICGLSYNLAYMLGDHKKIHSYLGKNPFKCNKCDAKYTYEGDLRCHMKLHLEKRCSKCGMQFVTRKRLENHLCKDRPFKCTMCEKAFMYEKNFRNHRYNVHNSSDNKPHDVGEPTTVQGRIVRSSGRVQKVRQQQQSEKFEQLPPSDEMDSVSESSSQTG